jgi:predicted DCC family thiol-disulfide oxidoreductase YuxK
MNAPAPILLYDGNCAVCSRIGNWVNASASHTKGNPSIIAQPVGNDPAALRKLNPNLDIWDAYAVVHVIMPDGTMKTGGEAVAAVFRSLPATRWLTGCLAFNLLGLRPFQKMLNLAYTVLDDVRPLLGCDSCGRSRPWVRQLERPVAWLKSLFGPAPAPKPSLHFAPLAAARPIPAPNSP